MKSVCPALLLALCVLSTAHATSPDAVNPDAALHATVAAAMAARAGVAVRSVDIRALQNHLIEKEILPQDVLGMTDSFPLPEEKLAKAVSSLKKDYEGFGVVLTDYRRSLPLLQAAFKKSSSAEENSSSKKSSKISARPPNRPVAC